MKDEGERMRDLKERTREYALRIVRLYAAMPKSSTAQVLGKQLLRSGTSVGAHYREATRSRSDAEFVSKIEGALQEIEETRYWLELIVGADVLALDRVQWLLTETDELTAILVTCAKRVKVRNPRRSPKSEDK
jgi:four helix bundle protein